LFADEYLTIHPGDFWSDIKTTGLENEGGVPFKNGKKPLKLLERILNMFSKKDIIVLDFFAGSGTTGEAVIRMNAQDGGNRQVILATYNEEPEGGSGIIDDACYPRIANHLLGENGRDKLPGNLRFFKTEFVDKGKTDDQTRIDLVSRCEEIISIRESTFTENHRNENFVVFRGAERLSVIIYETDAIKTCVDYLNKLDSELPISVYVFSLSNDPYKTEFSDLTKQFNLRPIPEGILAVYRRIFDSRIKSLGN
jgi:adenine-specific DNA-methyltransferase